MRGYIPVAGTHGWDDPWMTDPLSPFARMMAAGEFYQVRSRSGVPFRWSTDINGWRWWERHSDWEAGANALSYFLEDVPYEDRNLVAHSHGGQVVFICAAAFGADIPIRSLVTVGTPVRQDVAWRAAAEHIGLWLHVYDKQWDWIAQLGMFGDKEWSTRRQFDHPRCQNCGIDDVSHSKVLRDEKHVRLWIEQGWRAAMDAGPMVAL